MTPISTPRSVAIRSRISRAERSGSSGSSVTVSAAPTFDASTPALAHTKPWRVRPMTHAALHAQDLGRLAQHDLDLARVAVPALGERDRLGAGLDVAQVDDATLGLGDDLLGHDQHVPGVRAPASGSPAASARQASTIRPPRSSPGSDLGQLRQRDGEQATAPCRSSRRRRRRSRQGRRGRPRPRRSRSRQLAAGSSSRSSGVSRSKPRPGRRPTWSVASGCRGRPDVRLEAGARRSSAR